MNFALTAPNAAPITMPSREIAELTGKLIGHVHRDIGNMLSELSQGDDPFLDHVRVDRVGREYVTDFHLPHRETMILLTGYSVPMRANVVDRWRQLEAQAAKPAFQIPQAMGQALDAQQWELAEALKCRPPS